MVPAASVGIAPRDLCPSGKEQMPPQRGTRLGRTQGQTGASPSASSLKSGGASDRLRRPPGLAGRASVWGRASKGERAGCAPPPLRGEPSKPEPQGRGRRAATDHAGHCAAVNFNVASPQRLFALSQVLSSGYCIPAPEILTDRQQTTKVLISYDFGLILQIGQVFVPTRGNRGGLLEVLQPGFGLCGGRFAEMVAAGAGQVPPYSA